jgi:competence protein ComEA
VADIPRSPSREEHEFWNREFPDDRRPRHARTDVGSPRGRRQAVVVDGAIQRFLDRVHEWREDTRFGIAILVLIALVAGVVWYRIGIGGASAGESPASPPARAQSHGAARPSATDGAAASSGSAVELPTTTGKGQPSKIAVHVAGAVAHPGVVELAAGSRVIDAVEAVGGALAEGDLDRLNLAAKLADGQRVYVAKAGEADPGVPGDADLGAASGGGTVPAGKVNLNTASEAQLENLPGIGPTYAQAIIAERQRRGGFRSVNELRTVHGIGDKRFEQLAPLVTV